MTAAIYVAPGVLVPETAIEMRAVRSSGPGGQNVNKVASKVELHIDLKAVTGLSGQARSRLAPVRRDTEGRLLVTSQLTRDRHRNIEDARKKVQRLLARSLKDPVERRPTAPSSSARARRLDKKRRAGERKRERRDIED